MTLAYHSTYVQAPSVAPTTNFAGSTYQIRHRRVNLDGGVSLWSPLLSTGLPATITPQSYSDTANLLRDEFVVSDDNGVTWRVVPNPNNDTGAQNVPAFDSNWATTNNENTQSSLISNLDFGTFSDTEAPSKEFFVVNNGSSINNLKVNFIDITSGSVAINYFDRLQVDVSGTFNPTGLGSTALYDQSFVWASPQVSFNNLELSLVTNGFFKMTVSFINYPASNGMASAAISLGMELVADQRTFFLGFGSDWLLNSYYVDQSLYMRQFIEATSETLVVIKPYLVNINGVLFTNFGDLTKTVDGVDTGYQLVVAIDGTSKIYDSSVTVPAGETLLATFDITGSSPWVDNFNAVIDVKPNTFSKASGSVARGRFVTLDSNGDLQLEDNLDNTIGVSLKDNGCYATTGYVVIEVNSSVTVGDRLMADTDGKAVSASSGPLVALEDGSANDLVLASIVNLQGAASAGTTDLGYTASPTEGTVTSSTGTDAVIPAADATNAGLMLPAEKALLNDVTSPHYVGEMTQTSLPITLSGGLWTDDRGYLWIPPNGQSMGKASSSADVANDKLEKLFLALWPHLNLATPGYSISGGIGASAQADWDAGKELTIPNYQGRIPVQIGQGSGLTNRALGDTWGEEEHQLTIGEMPQHRHGRDTTNAGNHSHTGQTTVDGNHKHNNCIPRIVYEDDSFAASNIIARLTSDNSLTGDTSSAGNHSHSLSINSNGNHHHEIAYEGNDEPFEISQPSYGINVLWFLGEKA